VARFGSPFDDLAKGVSEVLVDEFCEEADLNGRAVKVAVFGPEVEEFGGGQTPSLGSSERIDVFAEEGKAPEIGQKLVLKGNGVIFVITAPPELDQLRNWWSCRCQQED